MKPWYESNNATPHITKYTHRFIMDTEMRLAMQRGWTIQSVQEVAGHKHHTGHMLVTYVRTPEWLAWAANQPPPAPIKPLSPRWWFTSLRDQKTARDANR